MTGKLILARTAMAALLGVGVLASSAGSASAYIVCNGNDCWHTDSRYHYSRDVRVEVHPDNWYFHRDWDHDRDHHWWNHHEGRGYYRNGVWVTF